MSAPFTIDDCTRCGHALYPPRALCPACAGSSFRRRIADRGVVEEVTTRRPVTKRRQLPVGNWIDQSETHLGSVRLDAGPVIIALVATGAQPGDRVRLEARASTVIALGGHVAQAAREAPSRERAGVVDGSDGR